MARPFYGPTQGEAACLGCTLPFCNKNAAGCAFRLVVLRQEGRDYQSRRDYHREYYRRNRDKKLAAAKARQDRLREECTT